MEVKIRIPDELAAEARARGVSVELFVQELLARIALDASNGEREHSALSAVERILELRKGNKLAGLQIKDLIHEGHQY